MKDYSFYERALKLDENNAGNYYAGRAVLYFRDMEYDLAWEDFQKARELGVNVKNYSSYEILELSKSDFDKVISNFDYSQKIGYSLISKYVGALLVLKRYSDACVFMGNMMSKYPATHMYHLKFQDIFFIMQNEKYKNLIRRAPKYESIYFWRINLYFENLKHFSKYRVKFYRQRINQDFDTLEKISKHPEYICLARSKYFENSNELKYALKFCRKAVDIAKMKNNKGFAYIAASILKDLYVKNYNTDKALELAEMLVETKPVPEVLAKAVNSFHYIPSLFSFRFPPEFQKYKSYKSVIRELKKRRISAKNKSAKAEERNKKRGY